MCGKVNIQISHIAIIILLFWFNFHVNGQNSLTGNVFDKVNRTPVADATVYINGTTKGTSTDSNGFFSISEITVPCQLMISRVGYDLKMINLCNLTADDLTVLLHEKTIQLSEVKVSGKNTRSEAVEKFREAFLGTDEWGKKANLLNDSVLVFNRYNDTVKIILDTLTTKHENRFYSNEIDNENKFQVSQVFSVKSKAPLIVDLPLLGYKLSVDLESFNIIENKKATICKYLGYYYCKPYGFVNNRTDRKYRKNRMNAFYISREHFCRMLYRNELKQNGYVVFGKFVNDSTKQLETKFANLRDFMTYKDENEFQITGLKGKVFYIYDFYNYANKPIDLTNSKKFKFNSIEEFSKENYYYLSGSSTIMFTSDTCTIRSDGTLPDNNIVFGGKISKKKVGATIPWDYEIGK